MTIPSCPVDTNVILRNHDKTRKLLNTCKLYIPALFKCCYIDMDTLTYLLSESSFLTEPYWQCPNVSRDIRQISLLGPLFQTFVISTFNINILAPDV